MHEDVDATLQALARHENAFGNLHNGTDRFIQRLGGGEDARLSAGGNAIRITLFGAVFVAIGRPILGTKGWVMEFVFGRQLPDHAVGAEVWRFYLNLPSLGSTPDIYADSDLQTMLMSGAHARAGDFILARIASEVLSHGMQPTPVVST